MKTIGIVGGMSPESTWVYYQAIVQQHLATFNLHTYPRIVVASVSFQAYIDRMNRGDWAEIAAHLQSEFQALANAGADFAVLATNTMHKVLPMLKSPIPIFDIFSAVAYGARQAHVNQVILTGTRFTMQDGFYADGLAARGLRVIVPEAEAQAEIHRMIFEELIRGIVSPQAVKNFDQIVGSLYRENPDSAVLLACTELELLTRARLPAYPFLDTTALHANLAWQLATDQLSWQDVLGNPK
ncbi:MAG TPA: amino acid racemase [Anaerolineales bacterium]|nr:amino acid racemase [Anaerolineales bacterium]